MNEDSMKVLFHRRLRKMKQDNCFACGESIR